MAVQGALAAEIATHVTAKSISARLTAQVARIASIPRLLGHSAPAVSSQGQHQVSQTLQQELTAQQKLSNSSEPPRVEGASEFCAALGTDSLADSQVGFQH